MKLKNIIILLFFLGSIMIGAQIRANLSRGYDLQSVEMKIGDLTVTLDGSGQIAGFYSGALEGNIDYYDNENFEKYRYGKVKNIGNINVDYWSSLNETDTKYGKIKNIGNLTIEY